MDKLHKHLPVSLDHAVLKVENHGKEAVDRLGLGLMRSHGSESAASVSPSASPMERKEELPQSDNAPEMEPVVEGKDGFEDIDSDTGDPKPRGRRKSKSFVQVETAKRGLRQLFKRRQSSPSPTGPSAAEEGRVPSNPALSPPYRSSTRAQPKPIQMTAEPERMSSSDNNPLTRTVSGPRDRSIRFAVDSSQSSGSAPGSSNYGAYNPGFKRNPALAMTRTTSVQSSGSQKGESMSVSFQEPEKRR